MNAWERLQELTFTPEKMTPLHWALWNGRNHSPQELLEQAAQQLEKLTNG